jgi:hypothetical protein
MQERGLINCVNYNVSMKKLFEGELFFPDCHLFCAYDFILILQKPFISLKAITEIILNSHQRNDLPNLTANITQSVAFPFFLSQKYR